MKKNFSNVFVLSALTLFMTQLSGCGGGGGGGSSSSSSSNLPAGSCSSSLATLTTAAASNSFTSSGSISSITQTESCSSSLVASSVNNKAAGDIVFNQTWKRADKEKFHDALASGENDDVFPECAVYLPEPDQGEDPACFGPRLYFQFHLDGDSRMSQNCDSGICELPVGDLGIWTDTEGDTNEACAAAKMNSDIEYVSGFTDMAKVAQSLVECLANSNIITKPNGNTETITDEVNTAVLNEKLSFSSVTWTESAGVYTINLQAGTGGSEGTVNIKTDKTGTPAIINIWGFLGGDSNSNLAFSLYGTDNGTAKNMKFISAIFEGTTPNTGTSGDFDSNNMLKLESSWSMDHRTILMNDPGDTTDKRMKYSWIAGNGAPLSPSAADNYSRTFLASVNADETTGVAYYGYGHKDTDRLSITNFLCNWTGPNFNQASGEGVNKAQKQVLSKSANTWNATESLIDYAPTRSCTNDNGSGGIATRADSTASDSTDFDGQPTDFGAASSPFTYGTTTAMGEEKVIASGDVELVDLTNGGDATNMTAFGNMVDPTDP